MSNDDSSAMPTSLVLPDFIANAGGVICAAAEYHGATEAAAFTMMSGLML